jgi:hypothetical protein
MWLVVLLPRMNSAQVSHSHRPVEDFALLGPLSCCCTISHCLSAIMLSLSARFNLRLRSSACPFTQSYVMSRPRHQFSCRSLIVLTKSWSPSMLWKILSGSGLLVYRTADSLLHRNVAGAMLIMPDRLSIPRTARPAVTPPSSDLYDCIRNRSPSSGPPPCRSMSSSSVATTQLWYPTPRVTDLSVAMLMFTGVVGSQPAGVRSAGISPTSLCTCFGSALIQVPMLDVYGTRGGGSIVVRCKILCFSLISTNWSLVFASTTCDALTGLSHTVAKVVKRRWALLYTEWCSHVRFEW